MNFNSRGAWGSSTIEIVPQGNVIEISIPVVRGGVQRLLSKKLSVIAKFQFPWCVGEFNLSSKSKALLPLYFNSRGAWGSSTSSMAVCMSSQLISIPVVRGGVQPNRVSTTIEFDKFQFPWCVGEFNTNVSNKVHQA